MLKTEKVDVWGFEHAIRGMRNLMNSWEKSDSESIDYDICPKFFQIGKNDLNLMIGLFKAGTEHRKFLRQIFVSMDIIAPLYWWKEADTYKVGTVANSCSTMHKIHDKPFVFSDFSYEHLFAENFTDEDTIPPLSVLEQTIRHLNLYRNKYLKTKDKNWWWQIIQLLPSSYNQRRTVTMNYENVFNIIKQRKNHKLDEWIELVATLEKLPYIKEIGGYNA